MIVGNGNEHFARDFREELDLDERVPLLIDLKLESYRRLNLNRKRRSLLNPNVAIKAASATMGGFRQRGVKGDPWQLGGVFVLEPGGRTAFDFRSKYAGDHPSTKDILTALSS